MKETINRRAGKKQKTIDKIRSLAEQGKTLEQIAKETNRKRKTLRNYIYEYNIHIKNIKKRAKHLSEPDRLKLIYESINNGAEYAEDVAKGSGISTGTLIRYSSKYHISLPEFRNNKFSYLINKTDPKKNRLIKRGVSLEVIAIKTNVTRQRIEQYIRGTSQHEKWRQSREHYKVKTSYKNRELIIQGLISQIEQLALFKAEEYEIKAYNKTGEYFHSFQYKVLKKRVNFETVFSVLKDYFIFHENNEPKPLTWFAEKYGFWESDIGRIFKKSGLKTMKSPRNKIRTVTPKYKKQALENSYETSLSIHDLAYFLRLPQYIVSQFFYVYNRSDKKRPEIKTCIKHFGYINPKLTYRLSSQIYEAIDAGFERNEIIDCYKINSQIYNYAISERENISNTIIESLKTIFPDKTISKPYMTEWI